MKTKIKRHSHAVLSVVLAVCMVLSCMTVGLIATDAAKVTEGAVGASTDTQPVSAPNNSDSAISGKSDDGALGANLDEDSPLGAANVYCVRGTFNSWRDTDKFNDTTKKVSFTLAAKTKYEFKIYYAFKFSRK